MDGQQGQQHSAQKNKNQLDLVVYINTSLYFQNSQSTINLSSIIPYSDSNTSLSNWEIESMFLLKVL